MWLEEAESYHLVCKTTHLHVMLAEATSNKSFREQLRTVFGVLQFSKVQIHKNHHWVGLVGILYNNRLLE